MVEHPRSAPARPILRQSPAPPDAPSRRRRWRRHWMARLVVAAGVLAAQTFFAANYVFVELRLVGWHGDVRLS